MQPKIDGRFRLSYIYVYQSNLLLAAQYKSRFFIEHVPGLTASFSLAASGYVLYGCSEARSYVNQLQWKPPKAATTSSHCSSSFPCHLPTHWSAERHVAKYKDIAVHFSIAKALPVVDGHHNSWLFGLLVLPAQKKKSLLRASFKKKKDKAGALFTSPRSRLSRYITSAGLI